MSDEVKTCPRCGRIIYEPATRRPGRPKRWCSARCRRAASEERRAAEDGAIGIRYITPEISIEQHVLAVLDSPAACRRILRELGDQATQGGLVEARWSGVLGELDRLRQPVTRLRGRSSWQR